MNNEKIKKKIVDIFSLSSILVCIVLIILIKGGFSFEKIFPDNNFNGDVQNTVNKQKFDSDTSVIAVNGPVALSYLSKDMIYTLRKNYVKKSVFKNRYYEPSPEVLGSIESNKPWMSVNRCNGQKSHANIDGASEESRDLNNPSVLISIDWPVIGDFYGDKEYLCTEPILPRKIIYNPGKKLIDVYYKHLFFPPQFSFILKGLNAHDFGYKYAYMDNSQSYNALKFSKPDNISTDIVELRDYIHVGGSCGVDGGCNNGSPYQPYLQFEYSDDDILTSHIMYFKLWKERPESVDAEPDIIERIIIDKK